MIRIDCFSISVDGFGAGPDQSLAAPLGVGGERLPSWFFPTRTFRREVLRQEGGTEGIDDRIAAAGMAGLGAWILGRNMFGPIRGPWPDDKWRGWWGDEPPYHCPVFVLTRHPRAPLEMKGGTVFRFVTGGLAEAVGLARDALLRPLYLLLEHPAERHSRGRIGLQVVGCILEMAVCLLCGSAVWMYLT